MRFLVLALALAAAPLAGHAQTAETGGHDPASHDDHAAMGVHVTATINAIREGVANISHGPIPEIGWPAMTMDMPLLEDAEMGDVAEGDEAMVMLEKGPDGLYAIRAIMPVE